MQYRLDYRQPAQRQVFAESRWAAPPSEMLQRRLLQALLAPSATSGGCRLRLEVDEFTQAFEAPAASTAVIVARAEVLPPRGENALARRMFELREPASSADAKGGVTAFRKAGERLTTEIAGWMAESAVGACRR
ncbi:putative lipoprotein [Azoarcus sp. CIB]|nr:putative lipoprotein [Azoarcus sp. CIB]